MRATLLTLATLIVAAPGNAAASESTVAWSVSPRVGQLWLDTELQDYRWDTTGQARLGVECEAQRGPWSAAVSLDRSHTVQATGVPGENPSPTVHWTSWSLHLRRLRSLPAQLQLHAGIQAGQVRLSWDPERLSITAPGVLDPVSVDFEPVRSWHYGPQLGLQWGATDSWSLVGLVEYSRFRLDTAHQSGGSVVQERRTFSAWQWSIGLALHPWSQP